jgi:hypothetical protein
MQLVTFSKQLNILISLMLLGALLPVPYSYFLVLRVVVSVYLLWLLVAEKQTQVVNFILVVLVVLFQPLYKFPVDRFLWNLIDIGLAIWLLTQAQEKKKND